MWRIFSKIRNFDSWVEKMVRKSLKTMSVDVLKETLSILESFMVSLQNGTSANLHNFVKFSVPLMQSKKQKPSCRVWKGLFELFYVQLVQPICSVSATSVNIVLCYQTTVRETYHYGRYICKVGGNAALLLTGCTCVSLCACTREKGLCTGSECMCLTYLHLLDAQFRWTLLYVCVLT